MRPRIFMTRAYDGYFSPISAAKCSADGQSEMMSDADLITVDVTFVASPRQHLCSDGPSYKARMTLGTRLNWAMGRAKIKTAAELHRRVRKIVSEQTIRAYLNDTRNGKVESLKPLAQVLKVDLEWLKEGTGNPIPTKLGDDEAPGERPIIGYVGAGGEASFEPSEVGMIELPIATDTTVAVLIRGESLGHGFDGWYAVYDNVQNPVTERLNGKLCVVGTSDGRVLIKWIYTSEGGHMLISGTGAMERNVELVWGAEVLSMQPRKRVR